jgi:hypothetical protein
MLVIRERAQRGLGSAAFQRHQRSCQRVHGSQTTSGVLYAKAASTRSSSYRGAAARGVAAEGSPCVAAAAIRSIS